MIERKKIGSVEVGVTPFGATVSVSRLSDDEAERIALEIVTLLERERLSSADVKKVLRTAHIIVECSPFSTFGVTSDCRRCD